MISSTLIIRADASQTMGAGHVLRSLAIGQQWKNDGGKVFFATNELPTTLKQRLEMEGISTVPILSRPGTSGDAHELRTLAIDMKADNVVLDGYQFGSDYQRELANLNGRTLVIDDTAHLPQYTADVILNQNLGATTHMYDGKTSNCELLIGPEFALVRREFLLPGRRLTKKDKFAQKILVTLGGSDPNNSTETIIDGLLPITQPPLEIRVILGQLNPHRDRLWARIKSDNRFALMEPVNDMSEQYAWADFAIAAGGSSNWEMCVFGLPRIIVITAENQNGVSEALHDSGIAISIGKAEHLLANTVTEATQNLALNADAQLRMKHASLKLVDGLGAQRVCRKLRHETPQ